MEMIHINRSVVPEYSMVFDFERRFNPAVAHRWMADNWYLSLYAVAIYLTVIYFGRRYMAKRLGYQLRGVLVAWNIALALFSLLGVARVGTELIYVLKEFGFQYSVCSYSLPEHYTVFALWTFMFAQSKVVELGDTAFIILRKQPLHFLHWYHHVTVLLYCWFAAVQKSITGRWFMALNYFIHLFMYTYYALKAMKFRIPRGVSMLITAGQLSQMIVGLYVNYWAHVYKSDGHECYVTDLSTQVAFFMYFTYFMLFLHFFYKAYINKKTKTLTMATTTMNGSASKKSR